MVKGEAGLRGVRRSSVGIQPQVRPGQGHVEPAECGLQACDVGYAAGESLRGAVVYLSLAVVERRGSAQDTAVT